MPIYLSGPPANPFTRLLAGLLGVLAFVGAAFFGLFLFAAAIGIGLVAWAVIGLRLWWLRRRLQSGGGAAADPFRRSGDRPKNDDDSVIEADYEVVSREDDER